MRILMLNNEFPPLGGGTASVNLALLRCFAQDPNLEIDLITSSGDGLSHEESFSERIRLIKIALKSKCLHHASNYELAAYAIKASRAALRLHQEKPYDFCFAWSVVPAGAVACMLTFGVGLPYLVRVCGPDLPGFEARYNYLYPFLTPIIRKVLAKSKMVIAKCAPEEELIRKTYSKANVEIIPNGVDNDLFTPGSAIPDLGPLKLLCVGRLIHRKGQLLLFEALHNLRNQNINFDLTLVGTGDAEQEYRDKVSALGLETQVSFRGYVTRAEMPQAYRDAHVFVLPTFNEGMSVATLEAIAAGLPVLVSNCGGASNFLEENKNGYLFEIGDVKSLEEKLKLLHANRTLARSFGAHSRVLASRLGWGQVATKYLELFSRM